MVMRRYLVFLLVLVLLVPVFSACHGASDGPLTRSMKGYELYSWQEQGQWRFTLITGTNRNKTLEEVTTGENIESEDGWVNIHVTGVDEIKVVLSRVPANEFVSWSASGTVTQEEGSVIMLMLPPQDIIEEINDHAEKCGLDLTVFGH